MIHTEKKNERSIYKLSSFAFANSLFCDGYQIGLSLTA